MQRLNSSLDPLTVELVISSGLKSSVMCSGFTSHAHALLVVDTIANGLRSLSGDHAAPMDKRNHVLLSVCAPGVDALSPAESLHERQNNIYSVITIQQVERDIPWITYGERPARCEPVRLFGLCALSSDLSAVERFTIRGGLRCE